MRSVLCPKNRPPQGPTLIAAVFFSVLLVFPLAAALPSEAAAKTPETPEAAAQRLGQSLLQAVAQGDFQGFLEQHIDARLREKYGDEDITLLLSDLAEGLGAEPGAPSKRLPLGEVQAEEKGWLANTTTHQGDAVRIFFLLTEAPPYRIRGFDPQPRLTIPTGLPPAELPQRIQAFLDRKAAAGQFSGAVIVAHHGKPLVAGAWGKADRATGRDNTLETPINLGSMNKMFTGLAIAQLQAQGKLDWQDTVGKHLPKFPNATLRDQGTIHQLLTHTSGVPMYWNDAYRARKDEIDTLDGFLETFVHEPLDFEPGTGNRYSNGGPVVLGLIIEKITGMSYFDFIRQAIYRPAKMTHSDHYTKDDREAGIAIGYDSPAPGAPMEPNTPWLGRRGSAAGGGYASANDLLRFAQALDAGVLLPREKLEVLWHPERRGAEQEGYGYLWGVGDLNGRRWVGHNGGAPGISADFRHYPDWGYTVIVLANQSQAARGVSQWINELLTANP